ncbi:MAG: aminotransferase class I/II-fold pyridoxal phosphate-dependent enzyme [Muribaculaceae bacterium]|nr:aminotransferase class I/II-fold pyridoxal phosphate-dependent enzyme [Muribaculaceae bacterium]
MNIRPADRVANVKEYYFAGKLREVAAMRAAGKDVISLGIGGPDLPPATEVIDALCEGARNPANHSYQTFNGLPELRRAFADWYSLEYGVALDSDSEILPLIGSKEGIMHLSMAFVNPGDVVLVPNPGYPTYTSASRLAGAEVMSYTLSEDGGWQPDFDALEQSAAVREGRVKIMWVNYPHMPTGAPASKALFRRIVDFGRSHGILIAHDNPYSFILKPEDEAPLSILSIDGARECCIEMNSLSKSHNMAGWRMAMMAGSSEILKMVTRVKSNVDSGQFKPVMLAATEALRLSAPWTDALNAHYRRRRLIAERIMTALGCSFDTRQRGMFLWGRIPDTESSAEALADRMLYEKNIFLTPGFIFGTAGERYIRISLCATEVNLERALRRITGEKAE